jgi:hypothetical protein
MAAQCAAAMAPADAAAESLTRLHAAVDVAARLSVCFGVSILVTVFAPPLAAALSPHLPGLLELLRALPRILAAAAAAGLRAAAARVRGSAGGSDAAAAGGTAAGARGRGGEEEDEDEDDGGSGGCGLMDMPGAEALLFGAVCAVAEAARCALAALGAAAPAPPPCSSRRAHVRPADWARVRF